MTSEMPESTANRGAVPPAKWIHSLADVQLVLTQIPAGINHSDANFPGHIYQDIWKESHAECKRMLNYELDVSVTKQQLFFSLKRGERGVHVFPS